jgi:hypothetical protein
LFDDFDLFVQFFVIDVFVSPFRHHIVEQFMAELHLEEYLQPIGLSLTIEKLFCGTAIDE